MSVADRVQGILPLVGMKSLLFEHFLVSMPFFNSGGIAADSPEAEAALAGEAEALAARDVLGIAGFSDIRVERLHAPVEYDSDDEAIGAAFIGDPSPSPTRVSV
jgi:hypothetical protein